MGTPKSPGRRIAVINGPMSKDFDPEEDAPVERSDESSGSEESDDDLTGTEHYESIGKSKLRKTDEVALGPKYAGSRVSRDALMKDEDNSDDFEGQEKDSDEEQEDSDESTRFFADPDDVDVLINDEDGDIDSEAAFGESDDEKFKTFAFRGSSASRLNGIKKRPTAADFMSDDENSGLALGGALEGSEAEETDEDVLDVDEELSEHNETDDESKNGSQDSTESTDDQDVSENTDAEDSESKSDDGDDDDEVEEARRAELRQIMNEEKNSVVATISQAAKSDETKGNAVKQQREAFGSLVSIRMTLQKALIATNSMVAIKDQEHNEMGTEPYQAAEAAALKLWNTLDGIRHQLATAHTSAQAGQKRKRAVDTSTAPSKLWDRMQASEIAAIDTRQSTLEKWSAKTRSGTAVPVSRRLNPTVGQQSITSVLQDQLANHEHLMRKTKIPRSCAPVQRDLKLTEDPDIYDDATFYQLVLKEFVDQKRMDALVTPALGGDSAKLLQITASKEAKTRKNVDTKASKGRKLRYTVHEKLQNFMAPEDRGSWEQEAVDRFFGTLFGQKMSLKEENDQQPADEAEDGGVLMEEDGLMLFRS